MNRLWLFQTLSFSVTPLYISEHNFRQTGKIRAVRDRVLRKLDNEKRRAFLTRQEVVSHGRSMIQ